MKKKIVFLKRNYFVKLHTNAMIITRNNEEVRIGLNDISTVVVDSPGIALTSGLIRAFADYDIMLLINNERHHPVIQMTNLYGNFQVSKMIEYQINKYGRQGSLWKRIVKIKINNQANLLQEKGFIDESAKLKVYSEAINTVEESDAMEAVAARIFFNLYGESFVRFQEDTINACLNYGYAIIRSKIVQMLVIRGINPAIGIHHHSSTNRNNLADDIIELFRVVVDKFVYEKLLSKKELDSKAKVSLIELVDAEVSFLGKPMPMTQVIDIIIQDYVSYLKGDINASQIRLYSYGK